MAPSKVNNSSSSSNNRNGEAVAQRANVLASCYVVDPSAMLKGLHYSATAADGMFLSLLPQPLTDNCATRGSVGPEVDSSGLPSPPSSPPLAAITSANELALTPKTNSMKRDKDGRRKSCREGAAFTIREECERLFCETMKTVFLGERDTADSGSIAMEAFHYSSDHNTSRVDSWLEIWDYAGGCNFRGFVAGTGTETCLFAFFSSDVVSHDLKAGLMALIELAVTQFDCSQVVICLDRATELEESRALMKSLRWVGFELITLEMWAKQQIPASNRWLFLGMEL